RRAGRAAPPGGRGDAAGLALRDGRQQPGRARPAARRASPGPRRRARCHVPGAPCRLGRMDRAARAPAGVRCRRRTAHGPRRSGRTRGLRRGPRLPAAQLRSPSRHCRARTLPMTPELQRALQTCASEPIHLSGAIQPHGYLISCRLPDWSIHHVSANIEALTGAPPEAMLRQPLREFITGDVIQTIAETVGFSDPGGPAQRAAVANIGPLAALCEVSVHAADGLVHIEVEPQQRGAGDRSPTVVAQTMIARVAQGEDEEAFHERVAEQVRQLTGYDRVMVYRFRHDDAGEVVAEARDADVPSYLGLRYPASDIPAQARRLYLHNRIRVIPDARYAPVPVLPDRTAGGQPLDLSQMSLRSVSPVHLEYLASMGVAATMSVSIGAGGRLWGLIACHHRQVRHVPPGVRAAADLFGLFVSMRVAAREQQQAARIEDDARGARDALALRLSQSGNGRAALAGEL